MMKALPCLLLAAACVPAAVCLAAAGPPAAAPATAISNTTGAQSAASAPPAPEAPALPVAAPAPDPAEVAARQARRRELQQQREQLEARIAELEREGGVYAARLQESWFDLGTTLQELEAWEEATEAFEAAWQAARISGGLEDPQQLAALRRLLASQRAAQQWEKADATAHLIQHISSRAHEPGSQERYEAVLQLGRWKLLAARDDLLPNPFGTALGAAELYAAEIAELEALADYPGRNLQLATLQLERASAEFLLAAEIRDQPLQEYFVSGNRSSTMLQCSFTRLPDGRAQQVCVPVEVPNLDFYVDPSNRKNQDIARHLGAMRDGIEAAYNWLKNETERVAERDALLADMQGLTESYNAFMSGGSQ